MATTRCAHNNTSARVLTGLLSARGARFASLRGAFFLRGRADDLECRFLTSARIGIGGADMEDAVRIDAKADLDLEIAAALRLEVLEDQRAERLVLGVA